MIVADRGYIKVSIKIRIYNYYFDNLVRAKKYIYKLKIF